MNLNEFEDLHRMWERERLRAKYRKLAREIVEIGVVAGFLVFCTWLILHFS